MYHPDSLSIVRESLCTDGNFERRKFTFDYILGLKCAANTETTHEAKGCNKVNTVMRHIQALPHEESILLQ